MSNACRACLAPLFGLHPDITQEWRYLKESVFSIALSLQQDSQLEFGTIFSTSPSANSK